jgi:hypothetical protein
VPLIVALEQQTIGSRTRGGGENTRTRTRPPPNRSNKTPQVFFSFFFFFFFFDCKTIVLLGCHGPAEKVRGRRATADWARCVSRSVSPTQSAPTNKKLFRLTAGVMYAGSSINYPQFFARRRLSSVVQRLSCLTTERQGAGTNPTADVHFFHSVSCNRLFYNRS